MKQKRKKDREMEELREEFKTTPVPEYTEEDYRKIIEKYTEKIHSRIQVINLCLALSKATAHTRICRGLI